MPSLRQTLLLALLFLAACKQPCKHCPNVAGIYSDSSQPLTTTCSAGGMFWSGGDGIRITVTQNGGQLTATREGRFVTEELSGALYEDGSVDLVSQSHAMVREDGTPGTRTGITTLKGKFISSGQTPAFTGSWELEENATTCSIDSPCTWTKEASN